jgi:hypothetical protein
MHLTAIFLFALPCLARNWHGLLVFAALVGLPLIYGWFWSWRQLQPGVEDLGVGILMFTLMLFTWSGAVGVLTRAVSPTAKRFGHDRPASLWVEGLGASATIVPIIWLAGSWLNN